MKCDDSWPPGAAMNRLRRLFDRSDDRKVATQIFEHAVPLLQLEPAGTYVAGNLHPLGKMLFVVPAVEFRLVPLLYVHHYQQDRIANVLDGVCHHASSNYRV
jgi:hypothetical protein